MKTKRTFNPSLRMPVIDIVVAAILIVVAGYFWFQTEGEARLAHAQGEFRQVLAANEEELAQVAADLEATYSELEETRQARAMRAEHLEYLAARIAEEEEKIVAAQMRDAPMVNKIQNLDLEIRGMRNQRMAYKNDLREADDLLAERQAERTRLETLALDRRQQIIDARTQLAAPPPSRFPKHIGVDLFYEGRGDHAAGLLTLSRAFRAFGPLDVGLLGSFGMTTDGDNGILEAGLFANMPLVSRLLSLDIEGGLSRLDPRGHGGAYNESYYGARLRFAPLRRERLYLIAGGRYGTEADEAALRAGIAFGRR